MHSGSSSTRLPDESHHSKRSVPKGESDESDSSKWSEADEHFLVDYGSKGRNCATPKSNYELADVGKYGGMSGVAARF